ncbi:metallophosphoesterase family protein [Lacipirellula parvula]|uniref:DNA repair exonuclease family protein YhaO n=1 Tax=Lacipirellula parvula TaxID=2650471 RepID=A0A5K7XJM5_9BACT|nr:DNA repair exonuclease [Lacipirellula parvula]BBO34606.1 DNA repair exonuclease family protein YhaO [Lacipirellula parvula]
MLTFLHAADIHLDSPLRGLDRYEGAPVEEIRIASRRAFENLVEYAIRERVAFVVLAGDLYDGDWKDFDTGLFFVEQMSRLRKADIHVFGVLGNHDAASKITRSLRLPANVHIFSTSAPSTQRIEKLNVAIHGQSFASQCTAVDLARSYPAAVPGWFNIGVLHTSMSGREGHGSYAPCSEACLRESGYDYWALGHVHQREVLPGRPTIAFPGNIQGRHIRESGPKGCLRVLVDDQNKATVEFVPLDVLRWTTATVPLDGAEAKSEVLERVDDALRRVVEASENRLTAVRIVLTGTTPLAADIAANSRQWNADVRATAIDVDAEKLWVEKVKHEVSMPVQQSLAEGDDSPLAEVAAIVARLTASENAASELGIDLAELERKLPVDIKETILAADPHWWREILADAEAKLLAELKG